MPAKAYSDSAQLRVTDTNVKLLLVGGIVGLVICVGLTIAGFSVAYFLAVNARASDIFPENRGVAENGSEDAADAAVADKKLGAGA